MNRLTSAIQRRRRELTLVLALALVACGTGVHGSQSTTLTGVPRSASSITPTFGDRTEGPSEETPNQLATLETIPSHMAATPTKLLPNATLTPMISPVSHPSKLLLMKTLEIGSDTFAYSPNGKLIVIGAGDVVRVYDLATAELVAELSKPSSGLMGGGIVTFSPDGSLVAEGGVEETIYVWEWETKRLVHELDFGAIVTDLKFSTDGKVIAVTNPGENPRIELWDLEAEYAVTLPSSATALAFSPSQSILASAEYVGWRGGGAVRLWDLQTDRFKELFNQPETPDKLYAGLATDVVFSHDGLLLATIINAELHLWDMVAQQEITWPLSQRVGHFVRVKFSVNGILATLDQFGIVSLFDPNTGQLLDAKQIDGVTAMEFSPDGVQLLVGGLGVKLQVWAAPTK